MGVAVPSSRPRIVSPDTTSRYMCVLLRRPSVLAWHVNVLVSCCRYCAVYRLSKRTTTTRIMCSALLNWCIPFERPPHLCVLFFQARTKSVMTWTFWTSFHLSRSTLLSKLKDGRQYASVLPEPNLTLP